MWRDGEGRELGEPCSAARRPKVQKGHVTKMSGFCREEPQGEGSPASGQGVQVRGRGMSAIPCNK